MYQYQYRSCIRDVSQMGPKCLSLFRGMFAFAIWDTDANEIFLARDHFGIKPLFYALDEKKFAFASELKTWLARSLLHPR